MEVSRTSYINQLWDRRHNGLVKISTLAFGFCITSFTEKQTLMFRLYWQEIQSFQHIHDSFQRILIQNEDIKSYYDENGIRHIGLFDFLLHPECIEK